MTALLKVVCVLTAALYAQHASAEVRWDDTCQVLTEGTGLTFDQATAKLLDEGIDMANNAMHAIQNPNQNDKWEWFRVFYPFEKLFGKSDKAYGQVMDNLRRITQVRTWEENIYIICNDEGLVYPQGNGKVRRLKATGNTIVYTGEMANTLGDCGPGNPTPGVWAPAGYGFKVPVEVENWEYVVLCTKTFRRRFLSDWHPVEAIGIDNYYSNGGTLFHELMHRGPNAKGEVQNLQGADENYTWNNCIKHPDTGSRNPESVALIAVAISRPDWIFYDDNGRAATREVVWRELSSSAEGQNTIRTYGLTEPH